MKKAKNGPFWRVIENLKLAVKECYQTGQFFNMTKIGGKCRNQKKKITCDIFSFLKQCVLTILERPLITSQAKLQTHQQL